MPVGNILLVTVVLCMCAHIIAQEELNATDVSEYVTVNKNGRTVYLSEELLLKLDEELHTWHWTPWLRTRTKMAGNVVEEVACVFTDSTGSFPDSLFTDEQLQQGAFLLYALFGMYSFTLLAIVCNDYFIPCVEMICEDLNIPQNVAAATFMSVATSCPEFFVNMISTFITESDMGIGTIVGSAIFNALGVAAIGSLAAITPIAIDMRPVTRDVLIYMVNVSVLVAIVWDGQIDWYEAVVLGVLYVLYFILMFNSMRLFGLYDKIVGKFCNTDNAKSTVEENEKSVEEGVNNKTFDDLTVVGRISTSEKSPVVDNTDEKVEKIEKVEEKPKPKCIFRYPKEKSLTYRIWWLYSWPLRIVLGLTIPSTVTCRKYYPLAFIMCIVWIGANSYCVSWSMTVIGHTFGIPESVMGMTFLAFGGCLPEACSIFIMSRRGQGGIGVSNALGANSLAILFALGLPWLIKTLSLVTQGAEDTSVLINSSGIDFVVGSLLVAVSCLWICLFIAKFKLRKSVGFVLLVLYLIFITFAVLVELGIILDRSMLGC